MITFKEFQEREYNTKHISNIELTGKCVKCDKKFAYSQVKKFMRNRKSKEDKKDLWESCPNCWLRINTIEDKEWKRRNSEAQKIAQNKPEQKQKNKDGVRRSWTTERRKKASKILKEKWKNDEAFSETALKNLKDINNIKIGFGSGGLKGKYNNIYYDSALELSFILWCEKKNIRIQRYDRDPIEYIDEDGISRKYYPDFIINENDVIEVKGSGLWYRKNYERNILKSDKARESFDSYTVLFEKDTALKTYYKTARNLHNETYKKTNN